MRDIDRNAVATGTATVKMDGTPVSVTWDYSNEDALTYTSTGTYVYTIVESQYYDDSYSTYAGVDYTDTTYTMVVTVTIDEDGQLVASTAIYKNYGEDDQAEVDSADFENTYDADDATYTLVGLKSLEGRTITANEFTISIQEYTDEEFETPNGEPVTTGTEANGRFDYTFTFDEVGNYYFTITEAAGSETGMTYDTDTTYYLWFAVYNTVDENTGDAVLGVSFRYKTSLNAEWSNDYTPLESITFANTYEAAGSTILQVRKYMTGRTFNEDDEFTFRVTAVNGAPLLEIDSNGKAYTVSDGTDADGNECKVYTGTDDSVFYVYTDSDGNSYILITVTGAQLLETAGSDSTGYYAAVDLLTLYYTQDDIGSVYTYRVTEEQGSANGVSYDVYDYGHAVDVTVSDAGNGNLSVTKSNTASIEGTNGEAIVVNTFSQGNVNIYGTKVWVDGSASHDNTTEVELTLYYSTDGGTTWTAWTSNGDGTWSIEGSGSYTLSWGTYNTNNWRILDLPQYSSAGADMIYKVVETTINGYVTTYDTTDDDAGDAEAVPSDNSSTNRYTITNTIEQEYLTISGTKTWVDGGLTHDNSEDVTLVVTRSSASVETETLEEETDYTVSWNGNTYTITGTGNGLPKYDDAGYVYTYTVTESATNGQITITIDGVEYTYDVTYDGYDITNTREEEESTSNKTEDGAADKNGTTSEGTAYAAYSEVSVGDEIIYTISYYNGNNTSAAITIKDILDNGVTWVSATNPKTWTDTASNSYSISGESEGTDSGGETYQYGGTVTWSFTADAFESGTVTLTVKVNENAKTAGDALSEDWNDTATVDNQATVTIADNEMVTDIVTNPLEDDDPTAPTKSVEIYDGDEDGDADYDDDDDSVSVGDAITYRISYYNNLAATATVTITDVLDDGVTYGSSTDEGTYDSDTHTVTWELTVAPFTGGYVYVTVTVNDNAKLSENTYDVKGDGTLDYGVNEENTTASIADEASVTVGNQDSQYTDVVENPLDSDEPQEPAKTISANSPDGYTTSTETVEGEDGAADTVTYNNSVGVGSTIEYVISCYNNHNYKTTVTITDELDDGVTFVSASNGGSVSGQSGDESTFYYGGTVTWTLEVEPLTEVTVYLEVLVNENARITEEGEDTATVENQATVTVGEVSNDTNIVVNPVDPDEPGDPDKVVSAASEAGIDGANVSEGDQITYTISFYNHNNSSADVTIVDELDDGVDFVSASFDGTALTYDEENDVSAVTSSDGDVTIAYDKDSHTVTWTIENVSAFTGGEVDLTVEVNSSAVIQVANDAEVTVGGNKQTTDVVTNPVDDEPEDPVKTESDHRIVDTDEDGTITYDDVAVAEEITYTISYYNYYGTPATITIEDTLDDGVEYIDSSDDGVYDPDTHTVTWTLKNVEAYEHGTVTLIVKVTDAAKETASDETEATVENQATVTVGDDGGNTTNLVINPLEDDDPQDPEKTESGYGEGTEVEEEDGNVIYYDKVSVGDEITYTISYYNHYAESATITIEDVLDEGVDYVEKSASDGGTYDEETRTLTWILENVAPFTEGSVTFTVTVNEKAMTYTEGETDADGNAAAVIENQATVTVGDVDNTTNIVINPLEDDEAEEPEKTESAITDAETGETYEPTEQTSVENEDGTATVTYNGVNVGDEIT
ncbi:MAG: DUF11 domain-containing protein, partial [Clostridiales bacterium]|nr:DUF11 domain-containing protein [Clostridiales bacterium]